MNEELSKIFLEGESPVFVQDKKVKIKPKKSVYKPVDGYAWNPIFQHMKRNDLCLCGSGAKWKKCCMTKQPRVVKKHVADSMPERIARMRARRAEEELLLEHKLPT